MEATEDLESKQSLQRLADGNHGGWWMLISQEGVQPAASVPRATASHAEEGQMDGYHDEAHPPAFAREVAQASLADEP